MATQTNETYSISAEYFNALKKNGLFESFDVSKIAKLTKERGMRDGKGYTNEAIRNFLTRQYTCSTQIVSLVTEYYDAKLQLHKQLASKQKDFISQLQEL